MSRVRTIKILIPKNPNDFLFQIGGGGKVIILKRAAQLRDQLISLLTTATTAKIEEAILSMIAMGKAKDADKYIMIYDAQLFIDILSTTSSADNNAVNNVIVDDDLDKYVHDKGCEFVPTPAIFDDAPVVQMNIINGKYADELDKAIEPEILPDAQSLLSSTPSTSTSDDFDVVVKGTEVVLRWRI